jgi:hypothetical protein
VPNNISDHSATISGPADSDQERVQRLCVLQDPVGNRIIEGKAGRRQQHHQWEAGAQGRPVVLQVRPGERQQDEETPIHLMLDKVKAGTWPATQRASTMLPAQNSEVRLNSR